MSLAISKRWNISVPLSITIFDCSMVIVSVIIFVERDTRVNRYLEAAAEGYALDAAGKPKIIVAIGREFGAGGFEIGQLLAQRLNIAFYDQQLNDMAAEEAGIPLMFSRPISKSTSFT